MRVADIDQWNGLKRDFRARRTARNRHFNAAVALFPDVGVPGDQKLGARRPAAKPRIRTAQQEDGQRPSQRQIPLAR